MICSNCGKTIRDDSSFCMYCGTDQKPVRKIAPPSGGKEQPIVVASPFYADKYEMKADLTDRPENYTSHSVSPVSVFLYLLAAAYIGLEVYSIIEAGTTDVEEIINYLFLNLLIPVALIAAGTIIQILSGIRSYLESISDGNRLKGTISIQEKGKEKAEKDGSDTP